MFKNYVSSEMKTESSEEELIERRFGSLDFCDKVLVGIQPRYPSASELISAQNRWVDPNAMRRGEFIRGYFQRSAERIYRFLERNKARFNHLNERGLILAIMSASQLKALSRQDYVGSTFVEDPASYKVQRD